MEHGGHKQERSPTVGRSVEREKLATRAPRSPGCGGAHFLTAVPATQVYSLSGRLHHVGPLRPEPCSVSILHFDKKFAEKAVNLQLWAAANRFPASGSLRRGPIFGHTLEVGVPRDPRARSVPAPGTAPRRALLTSRFVPSRGLA